MVEMTFESDLRRCMDAYLVHAGKGIPQEPHMDKGMEYLGLFCHLPSRVMFLFPGYNERGPDEPPPSTYLCIQYPYQPLWALSQTFLLTNKGSLPQTQPALLSGAGCQWEEECRVLGLFWACRHGIGFLNFPHPSGLEEEIEQAFPTGIQVEVRR